MLWYRGSMLALTISISLTSCAWPGQRSFLPSEAWNANERTALGAAGHIEKLISVPLNPADTNGDRFDLYYFVHLAKRGPLRKTVLFCAGGPGEIVQISTSNQQLVDFLNLQGYDVVYFHIRGSGFSQIPPSNQFDRFLRTAYVVEDIEEIRRDFLDPGGKWDAVIGLSYGTIAAQEYASKHPKKVKKLLLLGPISRHGFSFNDFNEDFKEIHRHNLERIYQLEEFEHLGPDKKRAIIEKVFGKPNEPGIFQRTEEAFGSLQFVVDNYCDIKKGILEEYNLKYSRHFFRKLRQIRSVGWYPSALSEQLKIGIAIRNEVFNEGQQAQDDCLGDKVGAQTSERVFYVMGTYDGINPRFLREWLSGDEKDIRSALRRSAGHAHVLKGVNKYIEKVGIFDEAQIEAWNPANHKHKVPTLILKGGADPVSAAGQAEYIYSKALLGERTLIEFPGIGHEFSLPKIPDGTERFFSGTIHVDAVEIPAGEIREVTGTVNGPALSEGQKMELIPPDGSGLRNDGFGILEEEKIEGPDKSRNNIIARIANDTKSDVSGKSTWTISNGYFTGKVDFDLPKIPAAEIRPATGTIRDGRRNKARALQFIEPDLEEDLKFLCMSRQKGPMGKFGLNYKLYFKNDNRDRIVNGKPQYWKIRYSSSGEPVLVEVDPPPLAPGRTNSTMVEVDPSQLDPDAEVELEHPRPPTNLVIPCLTSQKQDSTDVSVIFHNISENEKINPSQPTELTVKNVSFDATFKIDLPASIDPTDAVEVHAKLVGVRWKKRLDLIRPVGLEPELELIGFNILEHYKISMLLRNNGRSKIMAAPRNWTYLDPRKSSPCEEDNIVLDCLIYSFIVMEPVHFNNVNDNKILGIIQSVFAGNNPRESLPVKIEFCKAGTCEIGR